MNLQRRLAPEAKDESCTPTEYSIWTTTNLGYMNDQAAPNGGYLRICTATSSTALIRDRGSRSGGILGAKMSAAMMFLIVFAAAWLAVAGTTVTRLRRRRGMPRDISLVARAGC